MPTFIDYGTLADEASLLRHYFRTSIATASIELLHKANKDLITAAGASKTRDAVVMQALK